VILTSLCTCVQAQDWSPGCVYWVKQLNGYLDLKYPLPRESRASLARLLYEMVTTPGMDSALVEIFANCCIRLCKKKKKLSPEDLTLPWEPMYDMIHETFFSKEPAEVFDQRIQADGCGNPIGGALAKIFLC